MGEDPIHAFFEGNERTVSLTEIDLINCSRQTLRPGRTLIFVMPLVVLGMSKLLGIIQLHQVFNSVERKASVKEKQGEKSIWGLAQLQ
jgi:hypothetical protein